MHRSTRDHLESLLAGAGERTPEGHLSSCQACSSAVDAMRAQAVLLRSLRTPEEAEPAPGFYARVMQRIEERAKDSIWAVFVYSPFGKRLAYASLTIAVLLGSYVVAQESRDGHLLGENMVAQDIRYDAPVVAGDQTQQRDAVLVHFAVDQGSIQ